MATIDEIQNEINRLKKEKDICVLAHSYQGREIIETADFSGDSYGLAVEGAKTPQKNIILCGVRFMAETAKLLSPEKTVYLANPVAGCPMAEQMDAELIEAAKRQYPGYAVVAYVNTTAELKAVSDVCVTSSSAVDIVRKIGNPNILFIPDCNLGNYVAKQVPEKNIKLLQGGCPTHVSVTLSDVKKARQAHPGALLLVHPECIPAVVGEADFVGSTAAIMRYARESPEREFIIGTEISIAENLQYELPGKRFYGLSLKLVCSNMKVTTLMDLYHTILGDGGEEITIPAELAAKARRPIDEMVRLGG